MRYVSWARIRIRRLLAILLAIMLYFLLLVVDAVRFFPQEPGSSSLLLHWAQFGFSAFVGLMFLAVGTLVWLYARDRRVALLLFSFSVTMMATFIVQTGALSHDRILAAISTAGSALSLSLFSILLLLFPKDYLSSGLSFGANSGASFHSRRQRYFMLLLRAYLVILALLSVLATLYSVPLYLLPLHLPDWVDTIDFGYYVLVLLGILITIIVVYRQSSSLRERQQLRLFVSGVILAFAPLLLLTVLPLALNVPQYTVDSQLSTITIVLLPLALGYSILRYQILVFDMYVRRAVAWIAGVVGLAVLGYLVVMLGSFLLSRTLSANIIFIAFAIAVLSPIVWWSGHVLTERLFFAEILHYSHLINTPDLLTRETFDLNEASELITVAAVNAFETQEVCLFVLDKDTGYYRLSPPIRDEDPNAASRRRLVRHLFDVVKPSANQDANSHLHAALIEHADWLDGHALVSEHVASARRPLLLSEASKGDAEQPTGLARYLTTVSSDGIDPLLAAVRVQGMMIAILVLGERGDHQQYAGADFEAIELIVSRFSPVLETARLYQQASRHVATLNTLYSANATLEKAYESIEEVAVAYTKVAAEAVMAGAEIWLFDETTQILRSATHAGSGPRLISRESLTSLQDSDWSNWFYEGENPQLWQRLSTDVPSCLPRRPSFPFAWLPLIKGEQQFGVLTLTYPRPHLYSDEEKRILGMFAVQCAAAMENAQITIALRAAYELQKELDRLKDQFIMTASHELRTPLTAVQGYIELLHQYGASLAPETQADFIAKAYRGCDELVLMVGNIMDASRVQVDVEQVQLGPVPLANSIHHILEILEGVTRRENRAVTVDVAADLLVIADDLRLRQVLLNIISNALKYSPEGSEINICAEIDDEMATLHVRDYGMGVPADQQQRLFERFVRLERDMNSPVRGAGLGLYISKQLIEAMGGRIWVESSGEPGKGSTFIFTLKRHLINAPLMERVGERP